MDRSLKDVVTLQIPNTQRSASGKHRKKGIERTMLNQNIIPVDFAVGGFTPLDEIPTIDLSPLRRRLEHLLKNVEAKVLYPRDIPRQMRVLQCVASIRPRSIRAVKCVMHSVHHRNLNPDRLCSRNNARQC